MKLLDLLKDVEIKRIGGNVDREITAVAYHTRDIRAGCLFVAIRGAQADGHRFIPEAIRNGAGAIVAERELERSEATVVLVPNSRQALARVSSNFYGNPSSRVKLIGVTGTNGKTTTTYLLESIFREAGGSVGVIGTINYRFGDTRLPAPNTTPESLDLQRMLGEMAAANVSHVAMEVSSHGLDLDRIYGCEFDGAVFTNFTQDHLDYHATLDHYFASKKKLFLNLLAASRKADRFAATNQDDPRGEEMVAGVPARVIRYGLSSSPDVSAEDVKLTFGGLSCRVRTPEGNFPIRSRLTGQFNVYNILAAVSVGIGLGIPLDVIKRGVEALGGVSGRFETVENRKGIHVIVDYAHTPDALERVLSAIQGVRGDGGPEKIVTVFGCGGDRDRKKRPLMGEIVGRRSDLAVLTSDNPRTEEPEAIMTEVEQGFKVVPIRRWDRDRMESWRSEPGYIMIPDRKDAIQTAIRLAQRGDTLLIAGKGHEDYQIIGKEKFPFDDRVEVKKALHEK
jgi:UDP-N-acetylmuramoyl-L-alanyl-D-glutamate--2,6-diaminopimelate ligase